MDGIRHRFFLFPTLIVCGAVLFACTPVPNQSMVSKSPAPSNKTFSSTPTTSVTATIAPTLASTEATEPTIEPTSTSTTTPGPEGTTWFGEMGWIETSITAQTEQGPVIVKDGKIFIFNAQSQQAKETSISSLVFNTIKDAQKIVESLHFDEFQQQEQLLKRLFFNGYPTDPSYKYGVTLMATSSDEEKSRFDIIGIATETAIIRSPISNSNYPRIAVSMLNVYGYDQPLPLMLGAIDRSGKFYSTNKIAIHCTPQEFTTTQAINFGTPHGLEDISLDQLSASINNKPIFFNTLMSIYPDKAQAYTGAYPQFTYQGFDQERISLAQSFAKYQAMTLGASAYNFRQSGVEFTHTTGGFLEGQEQAYPEAFINPIFTPFGTSTFYVISP